MLNDLRKVLNMSEDEQLLWVAREVLGDPFDPKAGSRVIHLADLAFRLRDEVDFNIYLEELEVIYHLWQKRGTIDEQMENNLITFTCWLAVYITPIDRIIAALKAKEQK